LLDINNVYVSAVNHDFLPQAYLGGVPAERIRQHHLAGHTDYGDYIVDTHDHPVIDPVWELYAEAVQRFGPVSTMIERDDRMPPFSELMDELEKTRAIATEALTPGRYAAIR
ncbi:MAG: multinuclear nonheme iron-dependent oxidase, partial [Gammaproteobacteria bacterium]